MCLSNIWRVITSFFRRSVSILVLMDVPLEFAFDVVSILSLSVSILVLMDVPLECNCDHHCCCAWKVSILVLMDVPLELSTYYSAIHGMSCFNPCFNGCASRICLRCGEHFVTICFNPCFNGCASRILLLFCYSEPY